MLKNLTSLSFAPYGSIDKHGLHHATSQLSYSLIMQREVVKKQANHLFIHREHKTVLDIFDGTAILYVGFKSTELEVFLLDKTVVLLPNVYYYVLPLLHSAKISISSMDGTEKISIPAKEYPQTITPHIEPSKIYTLFYHEKERGFRSKEESHYLWELTYIDKGEIYNVIHGREFHLAQGDIMVFTPNQRHFQYAQDHMAACYITLAFEMDFHETSLFENVIFRADTDIKGLLSKILYEKNNQLIYGDDLILCYLKEIIIRLIRGKKIENFLKDSDTKIRQTLENDIVRLAKKYIERHLGEPISVGQVAKTIPVSDSYLSSVFKKSTGMTLIQYINREKLHKAKDLIRKEKYTFTQIADQLGYNNVHYFSFQFKKHFGITPTEFSNSIGG